MCGLFGYAGKPTCSNERLENFLAVLAIETSERGTDATGFAALADDGRFIGSKKATSASKFVFEDEAFLSAFAGKRVPRLMIGHCRLATHGDKANNRNNHPHVSRDRMLAIVHNGIVWQHKELADSIGATLKSECDSEVVLRLVEETLRPGDRKGYDHLVDVTQKLEDFDAMFSVLLLDRTRRCIWSFRNHSNPLVYWQSPQLGVTVFASELAHITSAARIVFGRKVAKKIDAYSPEPGRVARFNDRGRVSFSRRQAVCIPASLSANAAGTSSSALWASEYGLSDSWLRKNTGAHTNINDASELKRTPADWSELPHTRQCLCGRCLAFAKNNHAPGCPDCDQCDRNNEIDRMNAMSSASK